MHLNGHAMSRTRIAQKARKAVPGETMHIMTPPPSKPDGRNMGRSAATYGRNELRPSRVSEIRQASIGGGVSLSSKTERN